MPVFPVKPGTIPMSFVNEEIKISLLQNSLVDSRKEEREGLDIDVRPNRASPWRKRGILKSTSPSQPGLNDTSSWRKEKKEEKSKLLSLFPIVGSLGRDLVA